MTTLKELNGKVWYRFLKVVFILCYLPYFLLLVGIIFNLGQDEHEPILPNTVQEMLRDPEFYKLDDYDMREVLSSVDKKSNETWLSYLGTKERVVFEDLPYTEQNNFIKSIKSQPPTTPIQKKYIYKSYKTWNLKNCVIYGLISLISYILVMECIRRGFYYIVIGKVFPRE